MHRLTSVGFLLTCAVVVFVVTADPLGIALSGAAAQGQTEDALPEDIRPDSRNRLMTRSSTVDGVTDGAMGAAAIRRAGSGLNARWDSPLGRPLMELAILITAREHDQPYEWSLHEMEAVAVGLDPDVIDVVRREGALTGLGERERVIVQTGREIFGEHHLSADTYRQARELFGESNLVDVVDLMARYAGTAARLSAFNQQMPPGWPQFLPLPFTPSDDIDPATRSRLPLNMPEATSDGPALRPEVSSLYGRTLSPQGTGPGHIRRHGAGRAALAASVTPTLIDLATLVTAREYDVQYSWTLAELAALERGLEQGVIDIVRERRPVTGLTDEQASLITFGRELFGRHTVSAETYAEAVRLFGTTSLVDLVDVMAQQVSDATLLIAFDQHLPADQPPLLP